MEAIKGWDHFYVIVGSAAGALIGLQFVVSFTPALHFVQTLPGNAVKPLFARLREFRSR